jgi:hypothetical protein
MEALITRVQAHCDRVGWTLLIVVMVLSTVHLGVLSGEEIWKPPRMLIAVQARSIILAISC